MMKKSNVKHLFQIIIALVIALTFVTPGSAGIATIKNEANKSTTIQKAEMVQEKRNPNDTFVSSKQYDNFTITLQSSKDTTAIDYRISTFAMEKIPINGKGYSKISLEKEASSMEKGKPQLPQICRSIIIPDDTKMEIQVTNADYQEYTDVLIAPSKGSLSQNVNPDDIQFEFDDVYKKNEWYPEKIAELDDPYILRDFRGQVVRINPFQYNPVTKTMRFYNEINVEVHPVGLDEINVYNRQGSRTGIKVVADFESIYERHFLNFNSLDYIPVDEQGGMLIITHPTFWNAMLPFVQWKNLKGIPTEMVNVTEIGNSPDQIKNYISNYYNSHDLTFVLLVGDAQEISTFHAYDNGASDPSYSYLDGSDHYPDIFVGRFSAHTIAQVQTQVERSVEYERNPSLEDNGNWFHLGTGLAHWDDRDHMQHIEDDLRGYTYSYVDHFFGMDEHPADVVNALNVGRSIINFCGHGSATAWLWGNPDISDRQFTNDHVFSLTNDNKLPFIWSVACLNGQFDTNDECFAEAWLRHTHNGEPAGAIGAFMSSVVVSLNAPLTAQNEMVDLLVNNQKNTFGGLSFNGCMRMNDLWEYGYEVTDTWNLFGDPSIQVRTDTPSNLFVTYPNTLPIGSSSFTVHALSGMENVEDAYVCIWKENEVYATGYTNADGDVTFNPSPSTPGPMHLTVTKYNQLPFEGEIEIIDTLPPSYSWRLMPTRGYYGFSEEIRVAVTDYSGVAVHEITVDDGNEIITYPMILLYGNVYSYTLEISEDETVETLDYRCYFEDTHGNSVWTEEVTMYLYPPPVVNENTGEQFKKIDDAIVEANPDDSIHAYSWGSPYAENVVIDKPITLSGDDKDTTILDGGGSGDVIQVSATGVTISGFTIRNSGDFCAGINIESDSTSIIDTNVTDNYQGIYLFHSSDSCIVGNTITGNQRDGIYHHADGFGDNNIISGNTITTNQGDGIDLRASSSNIISDNYIVNNGPNGNGIWLSGSDNTLFGNTIIHNEYGINIQAPCSHDNTISENNIADNEYGISLYMTSSDFGNTIRDNQIIDNNYGIYLQESSHNIVDGNNISSYCGGYTSWGIYLLEGSSDNTLSGNIISQVFDTGIYIEDLSEGNVIYHNNFIDNSCWDAYDECTNTWYNPILCEGNYWDRFDELSEGAWDNNGDGIVDDPYPIRGGGNQDEYPLVEPWIPPDIDPPTLSNDQTPSTGTTGEDIIFQVDATDNIGVAYVYVYWKKAGDDDWIQQEMIDGGFGMTFYYWPITVDEDDDSDILYYFRAVDGSDNWVQMYSPAEPRSISITDNDPPWITLDASPLTGTTGDSYRFSIEAGDNIGVDRVMVTWSHGSHGGTNQIFDYYDHEWYREVTLDQSIADMTYTIRVRDTSGNIYTGNMQTVPVRDNDPPWIDFDGSPDEGTTGDEYIFDIYASDNIDNIMEGAGRVTVTWSHGSQGGTDVDLNPPGHFDIGWELSITLDNYSIDDLTYTITVWDSAGNTCTGDTRSVSVSDNDPPITQCTINGNRITLSAEDNCVGVNYTRIRILRANVGPVDIDLHFVEMQSWMRDGGSDHEEIDPDWESFYPPLEVPHYQWIYLNWTLYTENITVLDPGNYIVEYYSIDNNENVETTQTTPFSVDPPVAYNQEGVSVQHGVQNYIRLEGWDPETSYEDLWFEIVDSPDHGVLNPTYLNYPDEPYHFVYYRPNATNPLYLGPDSFTFRVHNNDGDWSNVATVSITIGDASGGS